MSQPNEKGLDGSSIKPVSSLRSHFENINKSQDARQSNATTVAPAATAASAIAQPPPAPPQPTATPTIYTQNSTARPISPPVKPDKLREPEPLQIVPPPISAVPPPLPKARPSLAAIEACANRELTPRSPSRTAMPPPPLSPRPLSHKPPSFMIQPPQSPPRGVVPSSLSNGDQPQHTTVTRSPSNSPKPFKIPSRPQTPGLDSRKSPILSTGAPSPPPPRRSAELKRDRETKPPPPPPPLPRLVNRQVDKPNLIPARPPGSPDKSLIVERFNNHNLDEVSPFASPSSSSSSSNQNTPTLPPPDVPSRPRTQAVEAPAWQKSLDVGFEPPPVHPSILIKRQEREAEMNDAGKAQTTPPMPAERPIIGLRGLSISEAPPRPPPLSSKKPPPPPPPPRNPQPSQVSAPDTPGQPKRVVSTPTTYQAPSLPRPGGRSMTIDRTSDRAPAELRTSAVQVVASSTMPPSASALKAEVFPDVSNANRRPPFSKQGAYEISTKIDSRILLVCGQYACITGHFTRAWNILDGELIMSFSHGDTAKGTSLVFKPSTDPHQENARLWIGNNHGEIMEADIATSSIVTSKPNAHGRYEIIQMYRHHNNIWSLDESGVLHVWGGDESGVPSLANEPHYSFARVPKGHTFSMVVGEELWYATGKEIRVFQPSLDGKAQFQVLIRPLVQDSAGEVTSGTLMNSRPDKVFFGHTDGKLSVYSRQDYACIALLNVSSFKVHSLAGVGENLWIGYNSGRIAVVDVDVSPCVVKKEWAAHENSVAKLVADPAGFFMVDKRQVVSLGADNRIRIWDGLLQEDFLENEMKAREHDFCEFNNIKALVMTWNAGASTPHSLRYNASDDAFIRDLLQSSGSPEILVFGFQELVDLEDKTATARRLFKSKKKEGSDQERMSHQYRDWRDFLMKSLDNYMPTNELYHLLHTSTLVGLFTCIFVKSTIRDKIKNMSCGEVKRGMGGLHGNKGAILIRFVLEDTSMCFINCHLAAGQSHAAQRHSDIYAILESTVLPAERDQSNRIDNFVGGGDGSMVLDHEICILNGDLNYRIDTMSRDTVVSAVKANNLSKLLERDQLLVARRRNQAFKLRIFNEMPITFAPTYKYDVGTDNYDTSEKRRSPAWCDRLLCRGGDRIQQLDYKRHEVRVSDHRPVTGRFQITTKRIEPRKRAQVWMECQHQFEEIKAQEAYNEILYFLTSVCGYDESSSKRFIKEGGLQR